MRSLVFILLLAAALRIALAVAMPCISRDGVVFCTHARNLALRGLALLHDPDMQQHPLYPAAILLVHRIASLAGAPDTPEAWQFSGQVVSILAGLALVLIIWAMTVRLTRVLKLPFEPCTVGSVAALLAAILPLNTALAADVMSDQPHALLYLLGLYVTMRLRAAPQAFATGLLAGLAFLTRPEGAAVVPAGWAAILARRTQLGWRQVIGLAAVLAAGFALLAGPYWAITGRISTKKSPLELLATSGAADHAGADRPVIPLAFQDTPARPFEIPASGLTPVPARSESDTPPQPAQARLRLIKLPPYAWLPWVLFTLLRAGRVVVVVFAAAAVWRLRRHLLTAPLAGWTTAAVVHLSLTTALLARWHYLAPRHLLVVVLLLIPFAAVAMVYVWRHPNVRLRPLGRALVVVSIAALLAYALRIPNGADGHLRRMANWIRNHIGQQPPRTLIGGWSQVRVAFYAGLPFEHWSEAPDDADTLLAMILSHPRPLVLFETGPGYERQGHAAALKLLQARPELSGRLRRLHTEPGPDGTRLILFEVLNTDHATPRQAP